MNTFIQLKDRQVDGQNTYLRIKKNKPQGLFGSIFY